MNKHRWKDMVLLLINFAERSFCTSNFIVYGM